ncbi:MAG TPA: tagaturonate reductase [Gemmatimonadaceae bacterium]|nr:tagaturonate reductase [Gemmatimonadaceae bacterium]
MLTRALLRTPGLGAGAGLIVPSEAQLDLPERAVQFGTGAFLRGFIDFFVDEANRRGEFNGRIVAIGSTESGRDARINDQDGLYTLSSRGIVDGELQVEHRIVGSVSRALSAQRDWDAVLECARSPELRVVFSNTTEVGISLDNNDRDPDAAPPPSFPGKLTRFLLERGRAVDFDAEQGVVVVPCELIEDNGDKLREMVLTLAARWRVEPEFAEWLDMGVPFCNTLVDRIVPGAPAPGEAATLAAALGYDDAMLTTAEAYRLFAIELPTTGGDFGGEGDIGDRLGFTNADSGIVLAHDITPFRMRKVRMLNGTHTISVSLALLAGCTTVREAVEHPAVGRFIRRALLDEISSATRVAGGAQFAREVLDRFANPYIRHELVDITLQGTMKMRVRVVPSIVDYAARHGQAPASLAFGFAAFLFYMRGDAADARRAAGERVPADDHADEVRALWRDSDGSETALAGVAKRACSAESLWGADLTTVPGFLEAVTETLIRIERDGVVAALDAHLDAVVARR